MDQSDIFTVTLNPALDVASSATDIRPGPKLRCTAPRLDPGGGGINVSRAIRTLGGRSLPLVALGGATGSQLAGLLAEEGIEPVVIDAPGETRHSLAVTDRRTGLQFRFVLPGPVWQEAPTAAALETAAAMTGPGAWMVLSGSQPPGVPAGFSRDLAARLAARGAHLAVDTSGEALAAMVAPDAGGTAPRLLRCDNAEASELAGERLSGVQAAAGFAARLVDQGVADAVMIACGADGSVLAEPGGMSWCRAARVPVVSKIGAGDSFMGAAILTLARGGTMAEALHHGTAAACAAVMTPATRLCTAEDTARLLPECQLRRLGAPR
ncbi:1-phosphofructokinase family hexose kinase [Mangrovicoccus algicola]|uniref:Phosphofructokinase n=1 Tax=Mangrovicoccus algicola TaxID=2771008 RepID=A0A8J6YY13_9RHOB|nr:hexose kinase [Mangrovicoccus algicola]MBE3639992.1 hexose kinase [Mangrovicoccus algicola]